MSGRGDFHDLPTKHSAPATPYAAAVTIAETAGNGRHVFLIKHQEGGLLKVSVHMSDDYRRALILALGGTCEGEVA